MNAPLRFGRFELQPQERRLLDGGREVPLGARAFDLLLTLAERAGSLVAKTELLDLVWPNVVVEENNLQVQISTLRKVLGPDVIATIPGRGYRFNATIVADAGVDTDAARAGGPEHANTPPGLRSNLPATLPTLVGRDAELATLAALVDAHRLVTLTGAGGVGKTLLALHVAKARGASTAHGACVVALAPLATDDEIVPAITTALGLPLDGGDPLDALGRALAPLDLFLVLDNAEHLVAGVAAAVTTIAHRAPRVRVLATSQLPLRVTGEQVLRLGVLEVPPASTTLAPEAVMRYAAVALFVARVRQVDPRFELDDTDVAAVIDIVQRLDGLPLALELAAARVPLLGVAGVAARLDERWRLLALGARDAEARHRSLRALLDWSHDLLAEPEQLLFRRLAVFVDGFALELAQAVATDAMLDRWDVVDALQALVDRSLVAVDSGEPPRYRLLESTQGYALEHLRASGEEAEVRRRHACAMRDFFAGADDDRVAFRARGTEGLRMQAEWRNGQSAVAWAVAHEPRLAVAIVAHIRVGMPAGMRRELHAMLDATEPHVDDAIPPDIRAAWYLVSSHMNAGRMAKAAEHAQRSFELARALGDPVTAFGACIRRVINWSTFDAERAAIALQELRALENPSVGLRALAVAAEAAYLYEHFTGHANAALDEGFRAAERYRACGDADSMRRIQANLVDTLLQAGRNDEAVALGASLVAALRGTRDIGPLTYAQLNLAAGLLALRRTADAGAALAEVWPRAYLYDLDGECAAHLALWCAQQGRFDAALHLAGYGEASNAEAGQPAEGLAQRSLQHAESAAREALDADDVARLKAEGGCLRRDDVAAVAFGVLAD